MEIIFMNTEDSKPCEPLKCFLDLHQKLDLKSSNKHVTLKSCFFITCDKI